MSFESDVQMTKEEEEYLKSLEEEFKDRYTENDNEFQAVLNTELPPPPIFQDWRDFRRDRYRDNDRYRDDDRYSGSSRRYDRYSPLRRNDGYSQSYRRDYRGRERTHASLYRPY